VLSAPTAARAEPFDEAVLFLEYNATDDDAEIVLQVDPEVGLSRLRVVGPNGKEIVDLRAKAAEGLGIRKVNLETPEPSLAAVLAAYPAGAYKFLGKTVEGETLLSIVWLSHDLPPAANLSFPLSGQTGVPTSGAAATWNAVPGAVGYFLELENDDLLVDVKSNIAASQTSFGFPEGWLLPDTEYQIGIAARAANGNLTVTELEFTTGP
jgi:hypothetical protein